MPTNNDIAIFVFAVVALSLGFLFIYIDYRTEQIIKAIKAIKALKKEGE